MGTINMEIEERLALLTIHSPPANALSTNLLNDLSQHLDTIEQDKTVKAVILKGEGKFFSAGADIKEFTTLQHAADYEALAKKGQELFDRIEHFPVPVIAAIHGAALGGGLELAMACHMRIVSEDAKLGLPEMTLGIIPGFAGTQRLPHYVGSAKAYEMILTGEPITGQEAYTLGLANQVVNEQNVVQAAMTLAEKIAAKSRPGINQVMRLIPYAKTEQFSQGVQREAEAFSNIFGLEDAKEGIEAFIEKRTPHFKDK
ncbi:MAG TPA: enoyl-CoA hydratase [Bacillota bacterium]|nr:enoyl-CoA hydratase [Bacillota bacterium]